MTSCLELGGGPKINEFRAEPPQVDKGDEVRLSWQVENLTSSTLVLHAIPEGSGVEPVSLGEVTEQTSTAVIANETTTYRLTASGPAGTSSREAKVSVIGGSSGGNDDLPTISYLRATPASGVEPGQPVRLEWSVQDADTVILEPSGETVSSSGQKTVTPYATTTYTIAATNAEGTSRASVTVAVGSCNCLLFVIAGQSNASGNGLERGGTFPTSETESPQAGVKMLTQDLKWVEASEPTHPGAKHSFGLRFAKEVRLATSLDIFLVPVAVGGSALHEWQPGAAYFENAVDRATHASDSLGVPVSAVLWLQGETESKYSWTRRNFIRDTAKVFDGFHQQMPGDPEILFGQLSKRLFHGTEKGNNIEGHNLAYQVIRESQRLMEAGAKEVGVGSTSESPHDRAYFRMVVAHDLPMSDVKHISAEGQRSLGQRFAHAFVNTIWQSAGESATGPRLVSITMPDSQTILVDTTLQINESSNYDGYFTVFDSVGDAPRERDDITVGRDPADSSRIRLQASSELLGQVEVRYMPPDTTALHVESAEAVHVTVDGLKLPLPAFNGPVEQLPEETFPGLRSSEG